MQVEDVTEARAEIGLYGPRAMDVLAAAAVEGGVPERCTPRRASASPAHDALIVRADESASPASTSSSTPLLRNGDVLRTLAAAGAIEARKADAEAVRIESGRPRFGADMDTDTIPLEAGLEDRAISRRRAATSGRKSSSACRTAGTDASRGGWSD